MFGFNLFAHTPLANNGEVVFITPTWTNSCSEETAWGNQDKVTSGFIDQAVQITDWNDVDKNRIPVRKCVRR